MLTLVNTDVVIMAGGLGTRLRERFPYTPKCLVPIADRPALFYHLDELQHRAARRVILSLGHDAISVLARLREADAPAVPFLAVVESAPLGYIDAYKTAYRATSTREVLVLNADTFCHGGIEAALEACRDRRRQEPIVATTVRGPDGTFAGVAAAWNYPGSAMGPLEQAPAHMSCYTAVASYCDFGTPEGYERAESYLAQGVAAP